MKTGALCGKHPGLAGRRYDGGTCPGCTKDRRLSDPEKHRKANAKWRRENPAAYKASNDAWRQANPRKIRAINLRRAGFTLSQFELAVKLQLNACPICEREFSELPSKFIHADHDHFTGLARGVLCHFCNAGLGAFADDAERLRRAIEYLDNPTLKGVSNV